jgi:hypothetical protein
MDDSYTSVAFGNGYKHNLIYGNMKKIPKCAPFSFGEGRGDEAERQNHKDAKTKISKTN